jgi:hypothetical protein
MEDPGNEVKITIVPLTKLKRSVEPENLFLQFARLPDHAQAMQEFADKHGTLSGEEEEVGQWTNEIRSMNLAIRLWLDLERLCGIAIADDLSAEYPLPSDNDFGISIVDAENLVGDIYSDTGWAPNVLGRFGLLRDLVSKGIEGHVVVKLDANYDDLTFKAVPVGTTLGGRIWLQLSRAVSEQWVLRNCKQCRTPFRLTDPRGLYCSPTCKVAASRARRPK